VWDDYKAEQAEIKAPEFLKTKTLNRMSAEKNKRKNFLSRPILVTACSLLVLFFISQNWLFNSEPLTYIEFARIELGNRHFSVITNPAEQDVLLEEVEDMLDIDSSALRFADFALDSSVGSLMEVEGKLEARVTYVFVQGKQRIEVMISNMPRDLETNSKIEGQPVALYYQELFLIDTTYIAIFVEDNIYYRVRMTGVTEDEFVIHLKEMINLLN